MIAAVPGSKDAAAWQTALGPRIRDFEILMWARAKEKAEETARNKERFLSENGAQEMLKFFQGIDG